MSALCAKHSWPFLAFKKLLFNSFLPFIHSLLSAWPQLTGNMKQEALFILCCVKQSNSMSWPWNTRHPTAVEMLRQINHLAHTSPFLICFGYPSKRRQRYIDFGPRQHKRYKRQWQNRFAAIFLFLLYIIILPFSTNFCARKRSVWCQQPNRAADECP